MNKNHLSQDQLLSLLADAQEKVSIGATYVHYKNQLSYKVLDISILESTGEVTVLYQAGYGKNIKFTRLLSSWTEDLEVQGKIVPRFKKV